jgi:hypothetical protein
VAVGLITSSSKYINLKLGKAIAIKIKAGKIVQTVSINVIHFNYFNKLINLITNDLTILP